MALVTWALIFPLITAIVYFLGPTLARIPLVPRLAITTGMAVPVMTWILMPRVTRLLRTLALPGSLIHIERPARAQRTRPIPLAAVVFSLNSL